MNKINGIFFQVKRDVYLWYIKAFTSFALSGFLGAYLFYITSQVSSNIWLSIWSDDNSTANDTATRDQYLAVYGALGFGQSELKFLFKKKHVDCSVFQVLSIASCWCLRYLVVVGFVWLRPSSRIFQPSSSSSKTSVWRTAPILHLATYTMLYWTTFWRHRCLSLTPRQRDAS